tara:strand:- start:11 stop:190 length:180 start_codon:yes stop_codon:yes gene_type:complete
MSVPFLDVLGVLGKGMTDNSAKFGAVWWKMGSNLAAPRAFALFDVFRPFMDFDGFTAVR